MFRNLFDTSYTPEVSGFASVFKGAPFGNRNAAKDHKGGVRGGPPSFFGSSKEGQHIVALTEKEDVEAKDVVDHMNPKKPPPRLSGIIQPGIKDIKSLMDVANKSKPLFDEKMDTLSKMLGEGGRVSNPNPDDYNQNIKEFGDGTGKPGIVLMIGPTKKESKVANKMMDYTDEDGVPPAAQVGDIHRATLAVDHIDQISSALGLIGKAGFVLGREAKVRIKKGTPAGYRDVLTNVALPNGHIIEVQVNTKKMLEAKERGHVFYNQQCDIDAKAKKEGRSEVNAKGEVVAVRNKAEQREYDKLEKIQVKIYRKAWLESGGT